MKLIVLVAVAAAVGIVEGGTVPPEILAQFPGGRVIATTGRSKRAWTGNDREAAVLRSDFAIQPDQYNYAYETANGIAAESSGLLKTTGTESAIVVQGRYSYQSPDGTPVDISYVADEFGYQPKGDVLPVAPPVPPAILRSLEYIEAHPASP